MFCEPQLHRILDEAQPDVIVEDNVIGFPALMTNGAPFVRKPVVLTKPFDKDKNGDSNGHSLAAVVVAAAPAPPPSEPPTPFPRPPGWQPPQS